MTGPEPELIRAAHEVLAELDETDRERVLRKFATPDELVIAMATCAAKVVSTVGAAVPDSERSLLLVATLTRGPQSLGVHANTEHAAQRFRLLRELGAPPAPIALQLDGRHDPQAASDAVRTHRVDTALGARRAEPPILRTSVAAAVAVACPEGRDLVALSEAVLDAGADLAARYRASGRPMPRPDAAVLGNSDFLVTIAAYARVASRVLHRVGGRGGTDLDDLEAAVPDLASALRDALRHPVSRDRRWGVDEPDFLQFLDAAVTTVGGSRAAAAFWRVRVDLRRDRLRRDHRLVPVPIDDLPALFAVPAQVDDPEFMRAGIEVRIVDELLAGVGGHEREIVVEWLSGRRRPNSADDLPVLLALVRRLTRAVLDGPDDGPVPLEPASAREQRFALARALQDRVAAADIARNGESWSELRQLAAALPPLWSRRSAAERALAAAARLAHRSRGPSAAATAALLGMMAARAPGQIAVAATEPQHVGRGDAPPRCRTGHDPEPAVDAVCPGRPWGRIGLVESYPTLATGSGIESSEAVRRRLSRYLADEDSPWQHLVRPRTP